MVRNLADQDPALVQPLNPATPLYHSWWSIAAIVFAHMPLGLLPHLGNKLWALKETDGQIRFVRLAFLFGLTMAMLGLGGLLARALLGDALYEPGMNPNASLPMLFIELFPPWLAALVGVGVLSAIMSTADGLVVSSSQIIANDLYRRTIVPRWRPSISHDALDNSVLAISRISTVVVLALTMGMAWALINTNIALIVWIGNGGMMAAFAGPLMVGALWRGVTRHGAYAGLISGFGIFLILHTQLIDPGWFARGTAQDVATWLYREGPNPYSCAAMGEFVSVAVTYLVSRLTQPLSQAHLDGLFGSETAS
jgi:sodium/proline symporter